MTANYDQPPVNTLGYFAPATQAAVPYPSLLLIATSTNLGLANYQAATSPVRKRSSSLQGESRYTSTKDLTNLGGCTVGGASSYTSEFTPTAALCDPSNPGLDYGNASYLRRNRFLTTFLYELPAGRGKTLLSDSGGMVDGSVGGSV